MRWIHIIALSLAGIASVHGAYYDPIVTGSRETFQYLDTVAEKVGYDRYDAIPFQYATILGKQMGQLDRIVVSPEEFVAHIEGAIAVRNRFFPDLPEDIFRTYLLPLRIRGEHTSHSTWHATLRERFDPMLDGVKSPSEAAGIVFKWIGENIELIDPTFSYHLPTRGDLDPLSTLKGKRGTEPDLAILACAILRSEGIPARIVWTSYFRGMIGGKVWLEFMDEDGNWQTWFPSLGPGEDALTQFQQQAKPALTVIFANPADPINITSRYSPVVTATLVGMNDKGEPQPASLLVINDNTLRPIFGRAFEMRFDFEYGIEVAPGDYIVSVGIRKGHASLTPVTLSEGKDYWYAFNTDSAKEVTSEGNAPSESSLRALLPADNNP